MNVAMLVGRALFALVFLGGAAAHILQPHLLIEIVASKGLRPARALVVASGALQLTGTVMVVLGLWADLGALLLFIFAVAAAILIHNFWVETDPQQRMMEQVHFNKNISLAGAALFLAAFVAAHGHELRFMLSDPLYQHFVR